MATHYRRHRKNEIKRLRRKAARQRIILELVDFRISQH